MKWNRVVISRYRNQVSILINGDLFENSAEEVIMGKQPVGLVGFYKFGQKIMSTAHVAQLMFFNRTLEESEARRVDAFMQGLGYR